MYTWGQIRLLLQQSFPGASLDAIDEKINSRYTLILSMLEWKGLEKSGMIETATAISAGTITVTQGSTAVSGTDTGWSSAITGMQLLVDGSSPLYTVTYVDATHLTLDRPFEGESAEASGYFLVQSIYSLPGDCRTLRVVQNPVDGKELTEMTELEFAQLIGFAEIKGVAATRFIPKPDLVDPATGLVTAQQIMLYPLPTCARGYPIVYEQKAAGFDGTNTSEGPLDFVSDAALLAGSKADLELEKETPNMARVTGFEAAFQKQFTGMLHVESRKRPPRALRMDPAYTRHRAARILRGFGGTTIVDDGF